MHRRTIASEQPCLLLRDFRRRCALCIIIRHTVHPRAHRVAPHAAASQGFNIFDARRIGEPRIKPEVVVVRIEGRRHAVVDG